MLWEACQCRWSSFAVLQLCLLALRAFCTNPAYLQSNPKFLDAVLSYQKKLGTVDVVLNVWGDVQKKWEASSSCGPAG